MKILLTGHEGYIGSRMSKYLVEKGFDVTGLDTGYFLNCDLGAAPKTLSRSITKDIRDVSAADLKGFDAIVHMAALSNDPLGDFKPNWTFDINEEASVRMAALAKEVGVKRFVYASSCSLYGAGGDDFKTEESSFSPQTPYADSKIRAEKRLAELADANFSPVFMRNATAYGLSPRFRADIVLNNLVGWAYTTGKIRLMSDGSPWRPIVHIEDIAHSVEVVLRAERENSHNQAFNVGIQTENYRVSDIANIVKEVVPGCEVTFSDTAGPDSRNYRVDFKKIHQTFPNFRPTWNAKRGAEEIYIAFKEVKLSFEEFTGNKYTRLNQLKNLLAGEKLDETLRWKNAH